MKLAKGKVSFLIKLDAWARGGAERWTPNPEPFNLEPWTSEPWTLNREPYMNSIASLKAVETL